VFFYPPHQDDMVLWGGQVVAHHTLVGRTVHAVLGTDGSTSAMRDALNGLDSNGWWGGYHYPEREGIPAPLSPSEFAAARDREMLQECAQLGIRPENIHLRQDSRTANLTVDQAKALILSYEAQAPGAGHYTTWWGDTDPNHSALGTALRQLAIAGAVADARWVVRRSQIGSVPGAVEYVVPSTYAAQAKQMARAAARCYAAWCPPHSYAIGRHSVPADFDAVEAGASNYIVKTP
jgi:LmbE family N-acetylglucosaminyl deacetylase